MTGKVKPGMTGKANGKFLSKKRNKVINDKEALLKALECKFTTQSTSHNAGMGLDNIRSTCINGDKLYIISNEALLIADSDFTRTQKIDFIFPGTLVFYNMSVSHFSDEDIESEFSF